ncbi:hypothetical protein [Thalassotalea piscium]|uniref:Uncharacterized protein n=1 Tax=Thalassotalea piscium TaxID=1230533 RepID=A0A7X0NGN6_9GAMM|nr:hypothetical protein [Thalassotalea piscium]MBB6543130.1 hypothetical protein [Thalassotalea piscium]
MTTRNPSKFLINKFKEADYQFIIPSCSVRFVNTFVNEMPIEWHEFNRDILIKKIREACEAGVTLSLVKRKRIDAISGYAYEIVS